MIKLGPVDYSVGATMADTDSEGAMSSEDEQEVLGSMLAEHIATRGREEEEDDDSDSFEREMEEEVKSEMNHNIGALPKAGASNGKTKVIKKKEEEEFYDDVYFNSDSDDEESPAGAAGGSATAAVGKGGKKSRPERKVKTNEELFYDPDMDEKDEQWVTRKRKKYHNPASGPVNDSVTLSCPACMTVLCRDCQQHETYHHQFRAMFVFSCLVQTTETLTYQEKKEKKRRGKKQAVEEGDTTTSTSTVERNQVEGRAGDTYHPVKCSVCQTKVGVYDMDEVYHFFNVLAT